MKYSFFQTRQTIILTLFLRAGGLIFLLINLLVFTACDIQEGEPFDSPAFAASYEIAYQADAGISRATFGNYLFDSLRHSVGIFERDSTSRLKVWLLNPDKGYELRMDTLITLNRRNRNAQLLQLASGESFQIYKQLSDPDSISVQRTQLFYVSASQPDSVTVTVVAVDRYDFLITARNDFSKADPLDTVAVITLKRREISPSIDLDLNRFNGGIKGYEAQFYYSIKNAATGEVVQELNKNMRLKVDQPSTSVADRFKAKYKLALMKWGYSSSHPFDTPDVLVYTSW